MRPHHRAAAWIIAAASFAGSLSVCAAVSAQESSVRTVLALYLGEEEFPTNPVSQRALVEALTSRPDIRVDYFGEFLESERFSDEIASQSLHDYIRAKYRGRRIDLVIAMTDSVLQFALDHRAQLFPEAPIVFTALQVPPAPVLAAGAGATGIRVSNAHAETLKLALDLHPSARQAFIVAHSPNERSVAIIRNELSRSSPHTKLTFIDEGSVPRLLAAVRAVPPDSLIVFVWNSQDEKGNIKYSDEFARLVAKNAKAPVYGTNDLYIGSGVVGGVVRDTSETGTRMAQIALQILSGTRAQNIPIEDARIVPTFDWRQVRHWGISPSRLPRGSEIRFRTPTVWESYSEYVEGTIIVVAAQLALIAWLLTERASRRRAESAIRASEASLRTSYERIRQMAGRLINAQEAARADIARDLHDDICQQLVYVSMGVSTLKNSAGTIQDTKTQRAFADLERDTEGTFEGIRRLSHDLHPASLRILGLAPALKTHCVEVEKRHSVKVAFTADNIGPLHPDIAVCFFRIAQESLRNGVAHGQATRFDVSLTRVGEHIEMTVTDNGRGFDVEAVRQRASGGLGLVSMEERVHVVGGEMQILTGIGRGTSIRVRAPGPAPDAHLSA
jgi:signal transduction histidine kinase